MELDLAGLADVAKACRSAGISDADLIHMTQEIWCHGTVAALGAEGAGDGAPAAQKDRC